MTGPSLPANRETSSSNAIQASPLSCKSEDFDPDESIAKSAERSILEIFEKQKPLRFPGAALQSWWWAPRCGVRSAQRADHT